MPSRFRATPLWTLLACAPGILDGAGCASQHEDVAKKTQAPGGTTMSAPARYRVYRDDQPVLDIEDKPGPLISTAPPPPSGAKFVQHPFLSATATFPPDEDELRRILKDAKSTADYLERLRAAGFRVESTK